MKRTFAGGRKVWETAKLRQYKYGGQNVKTVNDGDIDKGNVGFSGHYSAIFNLT
jgi:hypothetical protein